MSAPLQTLTQQSWSEAVNCSDCHSQFGLMLWKHNCRACGFWFCHECSAGRKPVPRYGHTTPQRVCNLCFIALAIETMEEDALMKLPVSQLRAYATRRGLDISMCVEKKDIVNTFIEHYTSQASRATRTNVAHHSNRPAPAPAPARSPAPAPSPSPSAQFRTNGPPQPNPSYAYRAPPTSTNTYPGHRSNVYTTLPPGPPPVYSTTQPYAQYPQGTRVQYQQNVPPPHVPPHHFQPQQQQQPPHPHQQQQQQPPPPEEKEEYSEEESAPDDTPDDELCVVCLDRKIRCVFIDCGHLACCKTCSRKLTDCPLCRKRIIRFIPVFHANKE